MAHMAGFFLGSLDLPDVCGAWAKAPVYLFVVVVLGAALTISNCVLAVLLQFLHRRLHRLLPRRIRRPSFLPIYRTVACCLMGFLWVTCWMMRLSAHCGDSLLADEDFSLTELTSSLLPWLMGLAGTMWINSHELTAPTPHAAEPGLEPGADEGSQQGPDAWTQDQDERDGGIWEGCGGTGCYPEGR